MIISFTATAFFWLFGTARTVCAPYEVDTTYGEARGDTHHSGLANEAACGSACADDAGMTHFSFGQVGSDWSGECWCKQSNAGGHSQNGITSGQVCQQTPTPTPLVPDLSLPDQVDCAQKPTSVNPITVSDVGCAGAKDFSGEFAEGFCKNTEDRAGSTFSWYAACCEWVDGQCVEKVRQPCTPQKHFEERGACVSGTIGQGMGLSLRDCNSLCLTRKGCRWFVHWDSGACYLKDWCGQIQNPNTGAQTYKVCLQAPTVEAPTPAPLASTGWYRGWNDCGQVCQDNSAGSCSEKGTSQVSSAEEFQYVVAQLQNGLLSCSSYSVDNGHSNVPMRHGSGTCKFRTMNMATCGYGGNDERLCCCLQPGQSFEVACPTQALTESPIKAVTLGSGADWTNYFIPGVTTQAECNEVSQALHCGDCKISKPWRTDCGGCYWPAGTTATVRSITYKVTSTVPVGTSECQPPTPALLSPTPEPLCPHLGRSSLECTPRCNNRCCMDGDCNRCYEGPTPGCLELAATTANKATTLAPLAITTEARKELPTQLPTPLTTMSTPSPSTLSADTHTKLPAQLPPQSTKTWAVSTPAPTATSAVESTGVCAGGFVVRESTYKDPDTQQDRNCGLIADACTHINPDACRDIAALNDFLWQRTTCCTKNFSGTDLSKDQAFTMPATCATYDCREQATKTVNRGSGIFCSAKCDASICCEESERYSTGSKKPKEQSEDRESSIVIALLAVVIGIVIVAVSCLGACYVRMRRQMRLMKNEGYGTDTLNKKDLETSTTPELCAPDGNPSTTLSPQPNRGRNPLHEVCPAPDSKPSEPSSLEAPIRIIFSHSSRNKSQVATDIVESMISEFVTLGIPRHQIMYQYSMDIPPNRHWADVWMAGLLESEVVIIIMEQAYLFSEACVAEFLCSQDKEQAIVACSLDELGKCRSMDPRNGATGCGQIVMQLKTGKQLYLNGPVAAARDIEKRYRVAFTESGKTAGNPTCTTSSDGLKAKTFGKSAGSIGDTKVSL